MPAPSLSWDLVRIYGTWRNLDGTLKNGSYKVTIPARVTDSTDDDIIPAGTFISGTLQIANNANPSLDILVPSTDDPDIEQTGWNVQIAVTFNDGSAAENYSITVPFADRPVASGGTGNGVNLRTVALPSSLPQTTALYKVGVPGGLAQLNSSGEVIDADGNPVTGSSGTTVDVATHAATEKSTPDDADEIPLTDSLAAFGLKKITWADFTSYISNAVATKADVVDGLLPVDEATTASVLAVHYTGSAWPARPTSRTDVTVHYYALTAADPAPTDFVADVDYLFQPTS